MERLLACLYIRQDGKPHQKHSYSAGLDYDKSPSRYYLRRVVGWIEKDDMARFALGKAVEQALEFHHDNGGKGMVEKFQELWAPAKEANLLYTRVEKDWETCNKIGADWSKLYIIKQPSLPIPLGGASVFQRVYSKEVFPGDENYGEIFDEGRLDVVSYVDPNHPLLPKIEWKPEWGLLRPVIIDIKTSGQDYDERPGMASYAKQLRRYSWQSGIRDVAFLAFIKKSLGYKKGSRVTLLTDIDVFKAGTEMFVAEPTDVGAFLVSSQMALDAMAEAQGKKADGSLDTTKAAKERKSAWLADNGYPVSDSGFTRQRIQFNAGRITEEFARSAASVAARQIVQIVNSWKNNDWPDTFSIVYPQDDRHDPYFKAFSLNDTAYRDEHFKIASPEDDFFEDEPEPEGVD
jgi:hypothetical protein